MICIVLTSAQKTALKEAITNKMKTTKYKTWANYVKITREDFRPIEIKNNLWVLPKTLKDNPAFAKVKDWILSKNPTIRNVTKSELIEYTL